MVCRFYFIHNIFNSQQDNSTEFKDNGKIEGSYYTPNSTEYNEIMKNIGKVKFGFKSEKAMFDMLDNENNRTFEDSATIFKKLDTLVLEYIVQYGFNNFDVLYKSNLDNLKCKLFMILDIFEFYLTFLLFFIIPKAIKIFSDDFQRSYLIYEIERQFIQKLTTTKLPEYTMQGTPINKISDWRGVVDMSDLGIYMTVSFIVVSISLVIYPIVEEKQDGIREILSIATSYSYLNQVSMYILNFLTLLAVVCINMALTAGFDSLKDISIIHPILLSIVFVIALLSFSFFISTFFESGNFFPTMLPCYRN